MTMAYLISVSDLYRPGQVVMQTQAELFLSRAIEYEKRAALNRCNCTLRIMLLRLADYCRQISKQAGRKD